MEQPYEFDIKEVMEDFKKALKKIDFEKGYNPESSEFNRALNIGLMWRLLYKISSFSESDGDIVADVIRISKVYLQKYIDTSDSSFKDMAGDMVRHATILVKKANARLPSAEEKKKLRNYEAEINEVMAQIEKM